MKLQSAEFGNTLNPVHNVVNAYLMTHYCNSELGWEMLYRQRYIGIICNMHGINFFSDKKSTSSVWEWCVDAKVLRFVTLSVRQPGCHCPGNEGIIVVWNFKLFQPLVKLFTVSIFQIRNCSEHKGVVFFNWFDLDVQRYIS